MFIFQELRHLSNSISSVLVVLLLPWCSSSPGDVEGELLVDVGSGPTLYQVLSACEVFNKVILTDFLEVNRQELKDWIQNNGKSKMDWTPFLKHVCKLEGRGYGQVLLLHIVHVNVHQIKWDLKKGRGVSV